MPPAIHASLHALPPSLSTSRSRLVACLAAAPSRAGTFTEVWEETFKQAAPAPTDYTTKLGAYRNGVEPVEEGAANIGGTTQKYFPEQHGYPAIGRHRQTFGVTWADYDGDGDVDCFMSNYV